MKHIALLVVFGLCALRGLAGEDLEHIAKDQGVVVFEQEVRGNHIFVYYVAWEVGDILYAPQLLARDHVYGNCLVLLVSDSNRKIILTAGTPGESDNPVEIDYSKAAQGILLAYNTTRDPRHTEQEFVRFSRTTIRILDNSAIDQKDELILEEEPYDAANADELLRSAQKAYAAGNEEAFLAAVGHLRNLGLNQPEAVLKYFRDLQPSGTAFNAAFSEILGKYAAEVEWARNERNKRK